MSKADYQLWVRRSGYLTLLTALAIVALKLTAAIMTNAASALASFMDALLDVLVSTLNFIALRYALKPADEEHRFGHGKAEAIMALFQAAFLTGAAVLLLYQGVSRYFSPEPVGALNSGIVLTLICTGLTLTLVLVQRWIIKKTASLAVKADSAHYSGDVLMNLSVIAALWLVSNSVLWADAVMAALIALYLLWTAWQLAQESLRHLLDEELSEKERAQIVVVLHQLPEVFGVDQLKTRQAGVKVFVQLRLLLSDQLSLLHAHDIVDNAEHKVAALFRDAEVIIHADPVSVVPVPEYPRPAAKTDSQL
ncbi:cation diffusion facilitator family transporter [Rheinheimera sp.]|uniref:cation diffusion facilitator family transporter n=1 Tax=Rheinheimera sp. TaxID=1869214 RepID=UPI0027BAF4D5|nr:cation diffusion facilitator family transporter [Rheinheimera sp.]